MKRKTEAETVYTRCSVLASYINGFIDEKRANGFKYDSEELLLNRFDRYCVDKALSSATVTKAFLSDWMTQTDTESASYCAKRISVVRQLLLFMGSLGIQSYIPSCFCHSARSLPHLFDPQELESFFTKLDSYQPPRQKGRPLDRLHQEYRLLFRIYCCCGVRNTEACGIATRNVDLDKGVSSFKLINSRVLFQPMNDVVPFVRCPDIDPFNINFIVLFLRSLQSCFIVIVIRLTGYLQTSCCSC